MKKLLCLTFPLLVAGCTSAWIENPSPSTRNLVNDLRLEGFECNAHARYIECVQAEPMRNKQSAKCSAGKGCVEQPDILVFNRYRIQQPESGIPTLQHDLIEKLDTVAHGVDAQRT